MKSTHSAGAFPLFVAIGTEAIEMLRMLSAVAWLRGFPIRHGEHAWLIPIDSYLAPAREFEGDGSARADSETLAHVFVESRLPDRESREAFQGSGNLYFVDPKYIARPGVREDGLGTGGDPSCGRADLRMNALAIRKSITQGLRRAQDHQRLLSKALREGCIPGDGSVPCVVISSTVGGTGSGAVFDVCRFLRETATELHVPTKIIVCALDVGTIFPPHRQLAFRNRRWALNALRAETTGRYLDPEDVNAKLDSPVADSILISSNAGEHSELSTLDEQEAALANFLYQLLFTSFGVRLRAGIVDLEGNRGTDASGALNAASTFGLWVIGLDRPRIQRFAAASFGIALAGRILSADPADAAVRGRRAATELSLLESEAESQASRLLTEVGPETPDCFEWICGAFRDGIGPGGGWRALEEAASSYRTVSTSLLPQRILPQVKSRAAQHLLTAKAHIRRELAVHSGALSGMRRNIAWIHGLLQQVEESDRISAEKTEAISQAAQPAFQEVDACRRRVEALSRRTWVGRLLRTFTVRDTFRCLVQAAESALRFQLETSVREILHAELYLPLREFLLSELAKFKRIEGALETARDELVRRAKRDADAPRSILRVPTGLEMADAGLLQDFWRERTTAKGGLPALVDRVFASLVKEEGSLLLLAEKPVEDVVDRLMGVAREPFVEDVAGLDVLHTLRKHHGDRLEAIVSRGIKESAPRIRTEGEGGREIPWIKRIAVPAGSDFGWLRTLANDLDRTSGEWEVVEEETLRDSVLFVTYRSAISLTMLIEQHGDGSPAADAAERVRQSADPVLALLPAGRATRDDARAAAAHAFLCGLLSHSQRSGFLLELRDGRERAMGKDADETLSRLQHSFPDMVYIYSTLAARLRDDGASVVEGLRRLESAHDHGESSPLMTLFDDGAIARVADEVEALRPYLCQIGRKESAG